MGKKICRLLEEERTRLTEDQKEDVYHKCRRDWEGQDNMMQFAGQAYRKIEDSELPKAIHECKELKIPRKEEEKLEEAGEENSEEERE